MLDLIYFSNVSENTHRFANTMQTIIEEAEQKINIKRIPIKGESITTDKPYILVCPAYGSGKQGHVPPQVKKFLNDETTRNNCVGVIGTGNINFGDEFAAAGTLLSAKLNVPLLHVFELAGWDTDMAYIHTLLQQTPEQIKAHQPTFDLV